MKSKLSTAELEEVRKLGASVLRKAPPNNPSPNKESPNDERVRDVRPPHVDADNMEPAEASSGADGRAVRAQRGLPGVRLGPRDVPLSVSANERWRNTHRESYNTYMKTYMRAYRERSK